MRRRGGPAAVAENDAAMDGAQVADAEQVDRYIPVRSGRPAGSARLVVSAAGLRFSGAAVLGVAGLGAWGLGWAPASREVLLLPGEGRFAVSAGRRQVGGAGAAEWVRGRLGVQDGAVLVPAMPMDWTRWVLLQG